MFGYSGVILVWLWYEKNPTSNADGVQIGTQSPFWSTWFADLESVLSHLLIAPGVPVLGVLLVLPPSFLVRLRGLANDPDAFRTRQPIAYQVNRVFAVGNRRQFHLTERAKRLYSHQIVFQFLPIPLDHEPLIRPIPCVRVVGFSDRPFHRRNRIGSWRVGWRAEIGKQRSRCGVHGYTLSFPESGEKVARRRTTDPRRDRTARTPHG